MRQTPRFDSTIATRCSRALTRCFHGIWGLAPGFRRGCVGVRGVRIASSCVGPMNQRPAALLRCAALHTASQGWRRVGATGAAPRPEHNASGGVWHDTTMRAYALALAGRVRRWQPRRAQTLDARWGSAGLADRTDATGDAGGWISVSKMRVSYCGLHGTSVAPTVGEYPRRSAGVSGLEGPYELRRDDRDRDAAAVAVTLVLLTLRVVVTAVQRCRRCTASRSPCARWCWSARARPRRPRSCLVWTQSGRRTSPSRFPTRRAYVPFSPQSPVDLALPPQQPARGAEHGFLPGGATVPNLSVTRCTTGRVGGGGKGSAESHTRSAAPRHDTGTEAAGGD